MGGNHELKFGFGYRDMTTHSATHYNGNQLAGIINSARRKSPTSGATASPTSTTAASTRASTWATCSPRTASRSTSACATTARTRRTWRARRPANASFPNALPGGRVPRRRRQPDRLEHFSPRVGLSYALDESRKTIVRASYARYAEQLAFGNVTARTRSASGYLAYGWNDRTATASCSRARSTSTTSVLRQHRPGQPRLRLRRTVNKMDREPEAEARQRVHRRDRP